MPAPSMEIEPRMLAHYSLLSPYCFIKTSFTSKNLYLEWLFTCLSTGFRLIISTFS
jgi:hypothetical protein